MHTCPRCGMSCDCNGDIDDADVMHPDWVFLNCDCSCEENNSDDDDIYTIDGTPPLSGGFQCKAC